MRLTKVEQGEGLKSRLLYGLVRIVSGYRMPDVMRTLSYRPAFFGMPHTAHTRAVMRGPSEWTVAEREIFAAYVSRVNECRF